MPYLPASQPGCCCDVRLMEPQTTHHFAPATHPLVHPVLPPLSFPCHGEQASPSPVPKKPRFMGKLVAAARPIKAGAVAAASTARAAGSGPKASTGEKGTAAAKKDPNGSGAEAGTGGGANGGTKVRFLVDVQCLKTFQRIFHNKYDALEKIRRGHSVRKRDVMMFGLTVVAKYSGVGVSAPSWRERLGKC